MWGRGGGGGKNAHDSIGLRAGWTPCDTFDMYEAIT